MPHVASAALLAVLVPLPALAQTLTCSADSGVRFTRADGVWTAESHVDDRFAFTLSEGAGAPVLSSADLEGVEVSCTADGDVVTCLVDGLGVIVVNRATGATGLFEYEGLAAASMNDGMLAAAGSCAPG